MRQQEETESRRKTIMKFRKESKMEEKKNRMDRILADENLEEVSGGNIWNSGSERSVVEYETSNADNGYGGGFYGIGKLKPGALQTWE